MSNHLCRKLLKNELLYNYVKDGLGNVIWIEKDAKVIVEYKYDAFGNCTENIIDSTHKIASINPFRWKSHYYDTETKMYYINGRYYDPEVGQYLDCQDIENILAGSKTINGLNRNAISVDNPISAVTNTSSIYTSSQLSPDPTFDGNEGKSWWERNWKSFVKWALFAIVLITSLALMCFGGPAAAAFGYGMFMTGLKASISGAIIGGIIGGIMSAVHGNSFWEGAIKGAIDGAVNGFTTGALLFCASQAVSAIANRISAANTPVPKTANQIGQEGENYIKQATGLEKNTKLYTKTLSNKNRIPDFIDIDNGVLIESKNVAYQGMTKQLKDYVQIAKDYGYKMELYVRQGTKLSSKIDKFIQIKYFPW